MDIIAWQEVVVFYQKAPLEIALEQFECMQGWKYAHESWRHVRSKQELGRRAFRPKRKDHLLGPIQQNEFRGRYRVGTPRIRRFLFS